jgi:hypothetical protein
MSTQTALAFGKARYHKPSPLVAYRRIREQQLAVANQIAAEPGRHCAGLARWAELVIDHETTERCPRCWSGKAAA